MTDYHDHDDHDDCDEGPACCKSCGVPYSEHMGLQGTCEMLREALAVLQETVENCGCCEDVGQCANCERAEAMLDKVKGRTA